MRFQIVGLIGIACLLASMSELRAQDTRWSPPQVYYGSGGKLSYTPDEEGNVIPDFSHVGYMYGDDSIPDVPVVLEIGPVEGDDGAHIQAAIDAVEAMEPDVNGFRGTLLLRSGTYQVNGQLLIQASGVVLRGEGQGEDGTVIIAEGTSTRDLIVATAGSSLQVDAGSKVEISEGYVPVGRKYVVVNDASRFTEGDHIALYRPGSQEWISDIRMDQITPGDDIVQWDPSSYSFYFERRVSRISGDSIFFRNPVVMAFEEQYGGGIVYNASFDRLEKVGVEDLCLKSAHASDTDEAHSWKAIDFRSVENSWVRRVTSWYFAYSCVSLERDARLISVIDCHCREPKSIITGGRRYSFNLVGSLNLFRDCSTTEGRHDYLTSSRVCGPNVFTRCSASNTHSDIGPHHRWAMGTLYDLIETDGEINVQDRDNMGTGHGWAGANQVFWNCSAASSVCQSPWASALNYNFGFTGLKASGARAGRPDGVWVGQNEPGLFPASLYEAQLEARTTDSRYFTVHAPLRASGNSTYLLAFSLPVDTNTVEKADFQVEGSAGFGSLEFELSIISDTLFSLSFPDQGELPPFATVIVTVGEISSANGGELNGGRVAYYEQPDLRPVVSGEALEVNNEDQFLMASSSKVGTIYLVKYPGTYLDRTYLEAALQANKGRSAATPDPGLAVPIASRGLPKGFYIYYAVDEDGRMSEPSTKLATVQETGPVLGWDDFLRNTVNAGPASLIRAWTSPGRIHIKPMENGISYIVQAYDLQGRLIFQSGTFRNEQVLEAPDTSGPILLRIIYPGGTETKKIHLV